MAGCWPRSFLASLWTSTSSRSINTQEKNLANIQPSSANTWSITHTYYISKLESTPWLVNLAGCTLLHGALKLKVVFVAKLLFDLSPKLNLFRKLRFKTFFYFNCVLKHANNLKNDMLLTCFRNLKLFLVDTNHSRTCRTHNRNIINILLTSSSWSML